MTRRTTLRPDTLVRVDGHQGVWKVLCNGSRAIVCTCTGLHLTSMASMERVDLRDIDPGKVTTARGILG